LPRAILRTVRGREENDAKGSINDLNGRGNFWTFVNSTKLGVEKGGDAALNGTVLGMPNEEMTRSSEH